METAERTGSVQLFLLICVFAVLLGPAASAGEPIDIGSRRELFVDDHLIDSMDGVRLLLNRPQPAERCWPSTNRGKAIRASM